MGSDVAEHLGDQLAEPLQAEAAGRGTTSEGSLTVPWLPVVTSVRQDLAQLGG